MCLPVVAAVAAIGFARTSEALDLLNGPSKAATDISREVAAAISNPRYSFLIEGCGIVLVKNTFDECRFEPNTGVSSETTYISLTEVRMPPRASPHFLRF